MSLNRDRSFAPHTAVLGLLLVVLVVSSIYPLQRLIGDRNRLAELRARSAELDLRIAELRERRDALQTDTEVERIARSELGMVRPGERAFALVPAASPPAAAPKLAAPRAPSGTAEGGTIRRWWDSFRRAVTLKPAPAVG